jgi:hypothetical protein
VALWLCAVKPIGKCSMLYGNICEIANLKICAASSNHKIPGKAALIQAWRTLVGSPMPAKLVQCAKDMLATWQVVMGTAGLPYTLAKRAPTEFAASDRSSLGTL